MSYGYLKTEEQFVKWLQSALRAIWSKHPSKLSLLQKRRIKLNVKSGKTNKMIFHVRCEDCEQLFKLSEVEVNHKQKCGGLSDLSKLNEFVHNLLLVQEKDLEILCKECHGIVTYMERYNCDRRTAIIEKKSIAFSKLSDAEQIEKCKLAQFNPIPKTKIGRKNMVREYLQRVMPHDC